mmetsp:Transcript_22780/g.49579  ORF Transcript_22780/g.49579 Transcript_22780/m.49579 type:complete len:101 (-) Transcript_22780:533-835(-)|eukprot:CAMPEP_0168192942 /NCGR_PEP_ID=MMETSP0139_2-20121125/18322_1 /TAXON_ID=44445 /ORGANISM="Pseudo-nitzschia australis, Strain 10249 10 AB" /LENGTH=100 /DNA_ID=CAMNT_0008116225 /DNA_START=113 /DNA_END=415 /DNA_ORIENTATION=+
MTFIGRDGTVGGREQKSVRRKITDFFAGIFDFIALFFSAITNPPSAIDSSRRNYAQRNNNNAYRVSGGGGRALGRGGGRGSNVRGLKNLQGSADAKMGGG